MSRLRRAAALLAVASTFTPTDSQGRADRIDTPYTGYPAHEPPPPPPPPSDGTPQPPSNGSADTYHRRPYTSAKYTYHAGVFDVHTQDVTVGDQTMVSSGVFAFVDESVSAAMEEDFWGVVDQWEAVNTQRFGTPVLGVDHSRVFHTVSATGMNWPWRQRLMGDELSEMAEMGFKTARLSFQWVEAEQNWEQSGLQYLYVEYLSEVKRLNSGLSPRNITVVFADDGTNVTTDYGPSPEYIVPVTFSVFVAQQGYDIDAVMEASLGNSYMRPAGSIYPSLNYTALAPELASNWNPDIGRAVYFIELPQPVYNHSYVVLTYTNETDGLNATSELLVQEQGVSPAVDYYLTLVRSFTFQDLMASVRALLQTSEATITHLMNSTMGEFDDDATMHTQLNFTVYVVELDPGDEEDVAEGEGEDGGEAVTVTESNVTANATLSSNLAAVCSCGGTMPPNPTCREFVPRACLAATLAASGMPASVVPEFCEPCVNKMVDNYHQAGACISAIQGWKLAMCPPFEELEQIYASSSDLEYGQRADLALSQQDVSRPLLALPKAAWMEPWNAAWYQQRQQWWDAQRKRYRPQVWALIERLNQAGIYTVLDFRPLMSNYQLCGHSVPPGYEPTTDMLLCFMPPQPWKKL